MKRQFDSWSCSGIWARVIYSVPIALALLSAFALAAYAADPGWWSSRGAVNGAAVKNDNAVVHQGQLKQFTVKAVQELNSTLAVSGGAGSDLNSLVNTWAQDYATNHYATDSDNLSRPYKPDDFQAVNVGQLKTTANLIYQRLQQAGYPQPLPSWLARNAS